MDNQWKTETCGTCNFVVEWRIGSSGQCRKNPPTQPKPDAIGHYPLVYKSNKACSCWRENNEDS